MDMNNLFESMGLGDLDAEYGTNDNDIEKHEENRKSQTLEGFASCFPDWNLNPPKRR